MMFCLSFLVLLLYINTTYVASLHKVVVPSVYKEWQNDKPDWVTNVTLQQQYNYSVFLYQKLDATQPNYITKNRGTEAGVYLRYIVDHYHNFPDVAVFVHAHPHQHQERWLELLGCIHPNASYINFNVRHMCRTTAYWKYSEIWVEQCWRDILSIVWDLQNQTKKLNERFPIDAPINVCFIVSQQFLLSRAAVQRRPLEVWKKLLTIIGEQNVCHEGPLDYDNLHAYHKQLPTLLANNQSLPGPETPNMWSEDETEAKPGWGAHTQGGGMEHLAHVVFGGKELSQPPLTNEEYCSNFLPNCPHTLCRS